MTILPIYLIFFSYFDSYYHELYTYLVQYYRLRYRYKMKLSTVFLYILNVPIVDTCVSASALLYMVFFNTRRFILRERWMLIFITIIGTPSRILTSFGLAHIIDYKNQILISTLKSIPKIFFEKCTFMYLIKYIIEIRVEQIVQNFL